MCKVSTLLDESIEPGLFIKEVLEDEGTPHRIDLSKIDFEALRKKFDKEGKHIETERLRVAISNKLSAMVRLKQIPRGLCSEISRINK